MKKTLWLISALILLYTPLSKFIGKQTHEFTICGISFGEEIPVKAPGPTADELQNIRQVLSQPFTFLDSGGQSFVFLSQDGRYILKFFRTYRHRLPLGIHKIFPKIAEKKAKRLDREFGSYLLAYQELREESGLLFLHLEATNFLNQKVDVTDNIGIMHTLSLDEFPFLLQKRVTLACDEITTLINGSRREEAQKRIQSLLRLTLTRYQKGIYDHDAFLYNYGFDGEVPIVLDIGRLEKCPDISKPEVYREDFALITGRLREWLSKEHPNLIPFLDELISKNP